MQTRWPSSGILLFVLLGGLPTPAFAMVPGDINLDGVVSVSDVQCIVLAATNPGGGVPECMASSDVGDLDCSGAINVVDVQLISGIALGSLNKAPGMSEEVDGDRDNVHDDCDINPDYYDPEQADRDTLATLWCGEGDVAKWNNTEALWGCAPDADTHLDETDVDLMVGNNGYLTEEEDPKVGTLIPDKWCRAQEGRVVCDQAAPVDDDTLATLGCGNDTLPIRINETWDCILKSALDTKLSESEVLNMVTANGFIAERVWDLVDENAYYLDGYVGVGTQDPASSLHVAESGGGGGDIGIPLRLERTVNASTNSYGVGLDFYGTSDAGIDYNFGRIIAMREIGSGGNTSAGLAFHTMTKGDLNEESVRFTNTGNVGIGTPTPEDKLEVVGSVTVRNDQIGAGLVIDNAAGDAVYQYQDGTRRWSIGFDSGLANGFYVYSTYAGDKYLIHEGEGADLLLLPQGVGKVGIGTLNPSQKLEVNGAVKANSIVFADGTQQNTAAAGSVMVLKLAADAPGATELGSCPDGFLEADTQLVSVSDSKENWVRTCYRTDKLCTIMYLERTGWEIGELPEECPPGFLEADLSWVRIADSRHNNRRTCYLCP